MARARHHYMADRFYGARKETDRIVAYNDAEAIREADPITREGLTYWQLRKVTRTSNEVIYDSRRQVPHA